MTDRYAASPRLVRSPLTPCLAAAGLAAALLCPGAQADSRTAAANLFANLARIGADIGVKEADALSEPTLVRGVYSLHTRSGQLISYTNESGTLMGDANGFQVLPSSGAPPRKLSSNEGIELRREFMASVDYDKLPRVATGDGGGRKLLMFSAIDCPTCASFEAGLAKSMREHPSTIYVVPGSLLRGRNSDEGVAAWDKVTRIWCAQNPGQAWQKYWQTRSFPAARSCMNGATAERLATGLTALFSGVDVRVKGFPTVLREDAHIMSLTYGYDAGQAFVMGRMGLIAPQNQQLKWLLAEAQVSDVADANIPGAQGQRPQPQYSAQPGQPAQPGKVRTSDLLKKLFK